MGMKKVSMMQCMVAAAVLSWTPMAGAVAAEHSMEVSELLAQADRALGAGNLTEALSCAKKAVAAEPQAEDAHNELGLCYVHMKRYPEATGEFRQALKIKPDYLPSLHNLGSALYRTGFYSEAIECWVKELDVRGERDPETLTSLADAYRDRANYNGGSQKETDFAQALKYYKEALSVDPTLPTLHNHLGVFYYSRGDLDLAADEIKKAIDLKHDYAAAYYNLALVEVKRHKLREAAQAFRDSLRYETEPEYKAQVRRKMTQLGIAVDGNDYLSNAYDLLGQQRYAETRTVLEQAVQSNGSTNAVAWNNLGYAYAQLGNYKQAVRCYRRAVSLLPGQFPSAEYNLGQALRRLGDLDGAQKCLQKAVDEAGGMNALAHNALGLVFKQKNQPELAKREYRLAIMQSGDTLPVVHFNLALVLEHDASTRGQAAAEYERYLEQAPEGLNAATARSRLENLRHS
jgi:tetratricopeptide (TPR) repeat protein